MSGTRQREGGAPRAANEQIKRTHIVIDAVITRTFFGTGQLGTSAIGESASGVLDSVISIERG